MLKYKNQEANCWDTDFFQKMENRIVLQKTSKNYILIPF
jgi:hypothetical protein